jgi:hypothetical protein
LKTISRPARPIIGQNFNPASDAPNYSDERTANLEEQDRLLPKGRF